MIQIVRENDVISLLVSETCNLECENSGSVPNDTCACQCPLGWVGDRCGMYVFFCFSFLHPLFLSFFLFITAVITRLLITNILF